MTNESRAAFEAWWGQPPIEVDPVTRLSTTEVVSAWAWAAWQASRKAALTEAIQVAGQEDSYQDEHFKAKADSVRRIKELLK